MNPKRILNMLFLLGMIVFSLVTLSGGSTALVNAQTQNPNSAAEIENTYSLTLTKVGNGTLTKSPEKALYDPDEIVTLSASAELGWQFSGWSVDLVDANSPANITMNANKSVTGTFTQRCFALTLSKSGSGTIPTAVPANSAGCSAGEYHYNASITLTATPDAGWTVSSWTGTSNNSSTALTNSVTMPAAAHAASVTYTQTCYTLTTNINPAAQGTVTPSPAPNCGVDKYLSGTTVQLTAEANSGQTFSNWTGAVTSTDNPVTLVMSANRTVTANFTTACFPLTLTHSGNGLDPVATPNKSNGCSIGEYSAGTSITLGAAPDPGWQVANWTGTNNDSSSSTSNTLTMPGSGAVASVTYIMKPTLQFSAATYSVNEDAPGQATIQVNRTGSLSGTVTVNYATSNGSAEAGSDYTAKNGTLTFSANQEAATFKIDILDDIFAEGTETVNLTLSNPSTNALLGSQKTAVLNILDDEGDPTIQLSSLSYSVDEGGASAEITISLFPAATSSVFVDISTSDGSAVALTNGQGDYDAVLNTTIRFNAGQIEKTISIPINEDLLDEPDETVLVQLSDAANADLDPDADGATLTIIDNDEMPTVQFSAEEYFANAGDTSAEVTITLSAASSFDITVDYDGNKPGIGGTVTIPAGATSVNITIPTANRAAGDHIILTLRTPENAALGLPASAILTILDSSRGDCNLLTIVVNGSGAAPTVSPISSDGCTTGTYVKDELISISAEPAPGWMVNAWQGTLNDTLQTVDNVIRMPDSDHTVTLTLLKTIYLPSTFVIPYTPIYFEGPMEMEPNDNLSLANGPLRPETLYKGLKNSGDDLWDVFYIDIEASQITIKLTNVPQNHNYQLYLFSDAEQSPLSYSDSTGNGGNEEITFTIAKSGKYYIGVAKPNAGATTSEYHLTFSID